MSEPRWLGSLAEYLMVWCADLLEPLEVPARAETVRFFLRADKGAGWPSRAAVQRHVEWVTGDLAVFPLPELHPAPEAFPALPHGYPNDSDAG